MNLYFQKTVELLEAKIPFVTVILVDGKGSIPQEKGSKMLVTNQGLYFGTVGGGTLEKKAIEEAVKMLQPNIGINKTYCVDWNLKKDLGKTCGGTVRLYFESYNTNIWQIVIFGAGHIAHALIPIILPIECQLTCIDPRPDWLAKLPESPKLKKITSDNMPLEVPKLPKDAFVLLMTMGHATDKPVLEEILKTRPDDFPYIGIVGSNTKANMVKRDIKAVNPEAGYKNNIYCPVGLDLGSNQPAEIAISISAQLLKERDKLKKL